MYVKCESSTCAIQKLQPILLSLVFVDNHTNREKDKETDRAKAIPPSLHDLWIRGHKQEDNDGPISLTRVLSSTG